MNNKKPISRREALRRMGMAACSLVAASSLTSLPSCIPKASSLVVSKRLDKGYNKEVSLLGFGCFRFPEISDGRIDELLSREMIDYAYEHGVNYFDTVLNNTDSQNIYFTGKVLQDYPRGSILFGTHMYSTDISSLEDAKELFNSLIIGCGMEYFDYFILNGVDTMEDFYNTFEQTGILKYLLDEKAAGRIRRLGFAFSGTPDSLEYLLAKHKWDVAQIFLNYFDWRFDPYCRTIYERLEEEGLPVFAMAVLKEGSLAQLNPDASSVLIDYAPDRSIASWAIRYTASFPNVISILTGMTAIEYVIDNVNILSDFKPLTKQENTILDQVATIYNISYPIHCFCDGRCHRYCPKDIAIRDIFSVYNNAVDNRSFPLLLKQRRKDFEQKRKLFLKEYEQIPENKRAHNCDFCGLCTQSCPAHLEIPQELRRIANYIEQLHEV